jgi:beta-lactamase class A
MNGKSLRLGGLALGMALAFALPPAAIGADAPGPAARLPGQVEAITSKLVGRTGFAATLLGGDNPVVALNGDEAFPMASAYKVAIAARVLSLVDKGETSLERMVDVPFASYVPGPVIANSFVHPGVSLSVANLIEVMIVNSDNTATDSLMAVAGGAPAVTAWLREVGIADMRVDRTTAEIAHDAYGFTPGNDPANDAEDDNVPDPNDPAIPSLEADPRDHATPDAMLKLLVLLDAGAVLSPASTEFLLDVMARTVTGPNRIKGLLPRDTPVAHKTGTVGGVANDVGYVTLPDGRRFAVAIFTRGSTTPPPDRDRAVAETARTLYDFFALQ